MHHIISKLPVITAILMALLSSLGDYFTKTASEKTFESFNPYLFLGIVTYGLTGLGWFFVFKKIPMAAIGIIDGLLPLIGLVLMGYVFFNEKLSIQHWIGVILAIIAIWCFRDAL